jgi:hypothetical protein
MNTSVFKINLPSVEEQRDIANRLETYNKQVELEKKLILESVFNRTTQNENSFFKWFEGYLINHLGYTESNILKDYKIENARIDLLLVDNHKIAFSPIAIVEFINHSDDSDLALKHVLEYQNHLNNPNIPCFLFNGIELFVLQSYGWQKISIIDFPQIDKLK